MITISFFLVATVALSFIVWCVLSLGIAVVFLWGDDTAFIKAPIISAFIVLCFWLAYSGVVVFK